MSDVLRRCVEIIQRHSDFDSASAEIALLLPGVSRGALRDRFRRAGFAPPIAYLAEPPPPPVPPLPRGRLSVPGIPDSSVADRRAAPTPVDVSPAASRLETPRDPRRPAIVVPEGFADLPRSLWPEPGELPQQYAADRTFVAPMPPIMRFGKPGDRVMAFPDTHAPYHDREALRLAERCVRAYEPTILVLLGDWMDFYSVSFHDRSPGRVSHLDDEIEVGSELLRMLERAAPNATRIFVEGNHENRLSRFLSRTASPLHSFRGLSTQEALRLPDNGWHWVPYHDMCTIGDIGVTHEAGHAGVNAARLTMLKLMESVLMGHTHLKQSFWRRRLNGSQIVCHTAGWLGNVATVDYRHRRAAEMEWSHGLGNGPIDDKGVWHYSQIPFINGRAAVSGEIVKAAA